nr:altered inheritance of mitochondria protein 9, mitochondrial [Quercus suber]
MHSSSSGCWRNPLNYALHPCLRSGLARLHMTTARAPALEIRLKPYVYTSGRWLVRGRQQLEARTIQFDFNALCRRVVQVCDGSSSIKSCSKKEGGFNRVFLFVLDNDQHVVARLPFSLSGPCSLLTNSEVATIKYLQSRTEIPIPAIIDWSDDPLNAVGSEYIIMEHASGIQLHQFWPSVTAEDKINFMDTICRISKEMTDIKFPAYGSLYRKSSTVDTSRFVPLDNRFYIGPHCGAMFWNCSVGQPRYYHKSAPNQGPCEFYLAGTSSILLRLPTGLDLAGYSDSLIDAGISRVPPFDTEIESRPRYHGSVSTHIQLLDRGRRVVKQIAQDPRIQEAACPVLFHPDLHKRNIFVSENDPAVVTSIIDWQSTSIEPAFWYADVTPDFALSHEGDADPASQLCAKAFEVCFQYHVSRLAVPRSMDEAFFRPFRYRHRTWSDGAVAFRDDLMETARRWDELGLPGVCALPSTSPEGLKKHLNEYRRFEAAQDLCCDLAQLLDAGTDGWVPCHEWKNTTALLRELYSGMVQAVLENEDPDPDEPVRTEADLREIWPFDLEPDSKDCEVPCDHQRIKARHKR